MHRHDGNISTTLPSVRTPSYPFFLARIRSTARFNPAPSPVPKSQQQMNGNSVSHATRIVNDFALSPRACPSRLDASELLTIPERYSPPDIPRSRWHGRPEVNGDTTATSEGRRAEREGGSRFNSERLVHIQKFCAECQDVVMLRPRALPVSS